MKRRKDETPSVWRILWMLLTAFLLPGCAAPLKYAELEAEAKRTGDTRALERFEHDVERADEFFTVRRLCLESTQHIWFCKDVSNGNVGRVQDPDTLDKRVKEYRRLRTSCGCMKNDGTIF